jgi:hypothetical protein
MVGPVVRAEASGVVLSDGDGKEKRCLGIDWRNGASRVARALPKRNRSLPIILGSSAFSAQLDLAFLFFRYEFGIVWGAPIRLGYENKE